MRYKRKVRELRFLHFKTWTRGLDRAVPACDPSGREKVSFTGQMTADPTKITCGSCVEALKQAGIWRAEW